MPRSIRPPVISLSVASTLAVVTSRVAGFVTHVPRRIRSVAAPMSVRRVRLAQDVRVEHPAVASRCLRPLREVDAALEVVIGLERDPEMHRTAWADEVVVRVRATVPEELPGLAHLLDLVEVEVANDELLVVRVPDVADELARGSTKYDWP